MPSPAPSAPGRTRCPAEGGTLILDHVEDQRSWRSRSFALSPSGAMPLGGVDTEAHVRFVAVGTADLEARVEQGIFRRDLFHRLEVLTFHLPPLRHRTSICRTSCAGCSTISVSGSAAPTSGSPAPRRWMRSYGWPGNLRQLRNVLERQMLFAPGRCSIHRLRPIMRRSNRRRPRRSPPSSGERSWPRWRRAADTRKAAAMLGISRKGLWEKRRRYGIP
ncbi:MAG: sigma 54-interacting transcriptional regulator [Thermoanaerobaculia bacterium]